VPIDASTGTGGNEPIKNKYGTFFLGVILGFKYMSYEKDKR